MTPPARPVRRTLRSIAWFAAGFALAGAALVRLVPPLPARGRQGRVVPHPRRRLRHGLRRLEPHRPSSGARGVRRRHGGGRPVAPLLQPRAPGHVAARGRLRDRAGALAARGAAPLPDRRVQRDPALATAGEPPDGTRRLPGTTRRASPCSGATPSRARSERTGRRRALRRSSNSSTTRRARAALRVEREPPRTRRGLRDALAPRREDVPG